MIFKNKDLINIIKDKFNKIFNKKTSVFFFFQCPTTSNGRFAPLHTKMHPSNSPAPFMYECYYDNDGASVLPFIKVKALSLGDGYKTHACYPCVVEPFCRGWIVVMIFFILLGVEKRGKNIYPFREEQTWFELESSTIHLWDRKDECTPPTHPRISEALCNVSCISEKGKST